MFKKLSSILNTNYRNSAPEQSLDKIRSSSHNFLSLIDNWPTIVGKRLALHTIPIKNTYNTLTILTDHSAFSQQLSFMEEVIKKKIILKYPCFKKLIKRIRFQTNSLHFSQLKEEMQINDVKKIEKKIKYHKFSPSYQKIVTEAEKEFEEIKVDEIKNILTSIFVQNRYEKDSKTSTDD